MLVPKLKFKEFTDEWYQELLSNISNDIQYGMNSAATDYDGTNKYIRITDINDSNSLFNQNDLVSPLGNLDNKFLVKENDILFARTGASTGKSYLYDPNDGKLYFAGFLIRANINNKYNSRFIFEQFKLKKYNDWVKLMSMRSGQPGINANEYGSYKLVITGKQEQDKIADFINLLNKKILLQEQKIEALKLYKKGLNNNIFANIINKISLREIVDYENGNGYENYVDEKGNYKLISLNSINIDGKLINNMKRVNIEKPKTLNKGDIVMVLSDVGHGDFLGVSAVIPNNNEYVLNQRMGLLRINNGTSPEYLVSVINYNQKKFKLLGQGSSQLNLSKNDILDIYIEYPNIQLQSIIAKENININKKIDLEFAKLELLNQLKKSLMQSMFV